MLRMLAGSILAAACVPAFAQGLEPGLWEFTNTIAMAGMPKPQSNTAQRCVTQDEAEHPDKWAGKRAEQADCKITMKTKTATDASWEMSCPKSGMHGTGSARIGPGTLESEQRMTGESKGQKYEMQIKTTGKRLGPCKT